MSNALRCISRLNRRLARPLAMLACVAALAPAFAATSTASPASPRPAVTAVKPSQVGAKAVKLPALFIKHADSKLGFSARLIGVPVDGRFKKYDATILLDPQRPEGGKVDVTIDLTSTSANGESEAMLQEPAWFHTAKYPKAFFVSQAIHRRGNGQIDIQGTLTIKGITHPLTVVAALTPVGKDWAASGRFSLSRSAYQLGVGEWADTSVVGNDVTVDFSWLLQGRPAMK